MKKLLAITALAMTFATPADASCIAISLTVAELPFEGRVVPRNVALRTGTVEDVESFGDSVLVGAVGVEHRGRWVSEGTGLRFDLDEPLADGLAPGAWTLHLADNNGERDVSFEVADLVDDVPPAVPEITAERRERGNPIDNWLYGQECGVPQYTQLHVGPADNSDALLFVVEETGERHGLRADDTVELRASDDDHLTIHTIDLAGNVSESVVVELGGCASMPVSTSLFAALLLLVRRRRRTT